MVNQWCIELVRRGWRSEVLTTDAYADSPDTAWIDAYRANYPIDVLPLLGPKGFGYSPTFKKTLQKSLTNFDLVHVHNLWSYCNQLAAHVCVQRKVPFLVSTHGMLDPHSMERKPLKKDLYGRFLEWPALRKASGIVFTHMEEERLARQTCAALPQGFIVPLGTEDPPAKSRKELASVFLTNRPELSDGPRVLFLSRLHSKKGLDLLLPAFRNVLKCRADAKLVLVGPGEPDYLRQLHETIRNLDIADRVLVTGSMIGESKWEALAAGDVYVLPSYQENFAIALVEALRVGTPVVCSQRVNIWLDLKNAGAATICKLTVESVADSILEILNNCQRASDQGARGVKFAAENYTWQGSVDRLMEVYHEVVNDPSSVGGGEQHE